MKEEVTKKEVVKKKEEIEEPKDNSVIVEKPVAKEEVTKKEVVKKKEEIEEPKGNSVLEKAKIEKPVAKTGGKRKTRRQKRNTAMTRKVSTL